MMIIDLKMYFLVHILLMRTYFSFKITKSSLFFLPPFDEMEEYPPMPVIVQPLGQHRGGVLELSVRGGVGGEHGNSEHRRVLRQAGHGAGLQGPGHLGPSRTYECRN